MTLFSILSELIDGYSSFDLAGRIGSHNDYDIGVAEDMLALTEKDSEEKILVALTNLLDGESAHDLVGWSGTTIEECQSWIDLYNQAIAKQQ